MYTEKATITNELGLHARTASNFVKTATKFKSDIEVKCNGNKGVAKSILSVMALNACKSDVIEICAVGNDEKEAVKTLVQLINEGCGE